jgi:hypothetical protein
MSKQMNVSSGAQGDQRKEVGLGQPPANYGSNCDQMLADQCAFDAPAEIAEVVQWRIDLPVKDADIPTTFGDRINVWSTPDSQPPSGVTAATNTLATPGLFACNMILRGFRVRIGVEPENRTILGNFIELAGLNSLPGSPDVYSINDLVRALGLVTPDGEPPQTMLPAELLYGKPTWKAAYALLLGYELAILKDHQDAIVKQPLTSVGTIQPFAEAEAAGLAFASNQDTVLNLNDRLRKVMNLTGQFAPEYFKRLGSMTTAQGALNFGVFTPSREADASSTMFGGIGVPQGGMREPLLFQTPMFWPAGHPISIQLVSNNQPYQSDFQRWISLTGGADGSTGQDLSMPFTNAIANHIMPTVTTSPVMQELTLDPLTPIPVNEQVETLRVILKAGTMLFEIQAIGWRVPPDWDPVVARAIQKGLISAPRGYGSLSAFINRP